MNLEVGLFSTQLGILQTEKKELRLIQNLRLKNLIVDKDKLNSYAGNYGAEGIPLKIGVFIRDNNLFIEVMNQAVQLIH